MDTESHHGGRSRGFQFRADLPVRVSSSAPGGTHTPPSFLSPCVLEQMPTCVSMWNSLLHSTWVLGKLTLLPTVCIFSIKRNPDFPFCLLTPSHRVAGIGGSCWMRSASSPVLRCRGILFLAGNGRGGFLSQIYCTHTLLATLLLRLVNGGGVVLAVRFLLTEMALANH